MFKGWYGGSGSLRGQLAALSWCAWFVTACGTGDERCVNEACGTSSTSGQPNDAGSSGSSTAGGDPVAGSGGAAPEIDESGGTPSDSAGAAGISSCETDADCADALGCNGAERCVEGDCGPGEGLVCPVGLQCTEQGADRARCQYAKPGRWLTYVASDSGLFPFGLRAVRLADNRVDGPAVWLSEGIVDDEYRMAGVDSWSPDGQHLIISNRKDIEHLATNRLFLVELGAGLPSNPVLLESIPVGGATQSGPWASDSSAVFVQGIDTPSESYLVRFGATGVRTELLSVDDDVPTLSFCENPRWFARSAGGQTLIVDSEKPKDGKLLWQGWTTSSPNGRWLLTDDETLSVAPCQAGSEPLELSPEPSDDGTEWTEDSRFLVVTGPEHTLRVLDSTRQFQKTLEASADSYFLAGSKLLLLGAPNAADEQQLSVVDLSVTPPKQTARPKTPAYLTLGFWSDGSVWTARSEASARSGFWVLEPTASQWRRVATQLTSADSPHFIGNDDYVSFIQSLDDGTSQVLAFSLHEPTPMPLSLFPNPLTAEVRLVASPAGLLIGRLTGLEPFVGALWWVGASPTGLTQPLLVSDVRAATEPTLQPAP